MTDPNDPAFPNIIDPGLTKREYIATKAMQGILSHRLPNTEYHEKDVAAVATIFADALIAELSK